MFVKINKLSLEMDPVALEERFEIFIVETTDCAFERGAGLFDVPLLCNNVRSVYFDKGNRFYVLLERAVDNKSRLKAIREEEGGEKITITALSIAKVSERVVVSLLLYATANYEDDTLRFNNLTGHLYCISPKWLKKDKKGTILKIPSLEISVKEDLRLSLAVRTFSSVRLKKSMTFTQKKPYEKYPKYVLEPNKTLRRALVNDEGERYILRQTHGDKSEIPFLDVQNYEAFLSSKMGVLQKVVHTFNKKYAGVCQLHFCALEIKDCMIAKKSMLKENEHRVKALLLEEQVRIVDTIQDELSAQLCEGLKAGFREKYDIDVPVRKRLSKKGLNLRVIHNASYYQEEKDPHDHIPEGMRVQHVTLEDFAGLSRAALTSVVHELVVKHDLAKGKLSLFDWDCLEMEEAVTFGMRDESDSPRYFFMRIVPDGNFTIREEEWDVFSTDAYMRALDIFETSKDVVGTVEYGHGDINIIKNTQWITLPEIERIGNYLKSGNTYLRGKEKREELFCAITDVKAFEKDDGLYYFSGIIGEGMRTKVVHAANIRCVTAYEESAIHTKDLLPLMNVPFVRNGQLTVMPFPMKYLREYIRALR